MTKESNYFMVTGIGSCLCFQYFVPINTKNSVQSHLSKYNCEYGLLTQKTGFKLINLNTIVGTVY